MANKFPSNISWILDLLNLVQGTIIQVPTDYRQQVLSVKNLMDNDETGTISTLLDFAISSASDVEFTAESDNSNLSEIFNNWLSSINEELLGKIPIGIEALAKEYYRERWKGSSFLLLRTVWGDVGGYKLPIKMWFVDGENIRVDSANGTVAIGDEKVELIVDTNNPNKNILLPSNKQEKIFIQKPYTAWGTDYPTPYIIQRGLYKNALFLKTLANKGEIVISKALEYLMVVKKGAESLAKENRSEFIYSDEDLRAVKKNLGMLIDGRTTTAGVPSYITNFDTDIEHLIPEYEKILKPALYAPVERRILFGLGMVDVVDAAGNSRREGILNPKPYIGELNSGVNDFKQLIKDILLTIVQENKDTHPKFLANPRAITMRNTPVKAFMSEDYRTVLRSLYDRGALSKKTFVEVVGDVDYIQEKQRRMKEIEEGDELLMFPPVIQNLENVRSTEEDERLGKEPIDKKETDKENNKPENIEDEDKDDDKIGPESRNYNNSEVFEQAPYDKISDLPDNVKDVMSKSLQKIWMDIFNKSYPEGEDYARKVAWDVIKRIAEKNSKGIWTRKKSKGSLETAIIEAEENIKESNDL